MGNGAYKALRRQDITFEDKDQALRDDVRILGTLVGELIREQATTCASSVRSSVS
jgi:hypothetical protein